MFESGDNNTFTEEEIGNAKQILVPLLLDSTPGFVTLYRFKELLAVLP